MTPPPQPTRLTKSQAIDDLIMGTNSSSITSKRSVERLYYPDEPHFFRFFVNKFQRRAPLINRGYWLRLRAIDVIVRQFLAKPSSAKKVVVNLGCGSDVLPWQCHARYPADCENALFVDADYPDLIKKKRAIVLETPELRELLGSDFTTTTSDVEPLVLRSDKYCQLGCDLRQLELLRSTFESFLDLSNCHVLFVAEVSITYMDTASADSLIAWASSMGKAEFCLLEQILPHGPDHPFAQTMLRHFNKLNTPPKSVGAYPTCESQKNRFKNRGWAHVEVWDLWEAWSGSQFVSPPERAALDHVEAFDEWEEFMLFARHYFVLHASVSRQHETEADQDLQEARDQATVLQTSTTLHEVKGATKRRFGSAMLVKDPMGQRYAVHLMGMGSSGRTDSCDVFAVGPQCTTAELPLDGPRPRVCHTLTDLGDDGHLLIGGRGSPTAGFSDCWLFTKGSRPIWKATWKLPVPLFRHSALKLRNSSLVLVAGGKIDASHISGSYYVYHPLRGWLDCDIRGNRPDPTFGAILCNSSDSGLAPGAFHGIMTGGIVQDGILSTRKYSWTLYMTTPKPEISFEEFSSSQTLTDHLSSFGSQSIDLGSFTAICGGMGHDASIQGHTISIVAVSKETGSKYNLIRTSSDKNLSESPFMIGSSVIAVDETIIVLGGGATCFSMGTYFQTDVYTIDLSEIVTKVSSKSTAPCPLTLQYVESRKFASAAPRETLVADSAQRITVKPIPRIKLDSGEKFLDILRARQPMIMEGLNLGDCIDKWTPDYMVQRVGGDKEAVIHESLRDTEKLDFNFKNFRYATADFASIMSRAQAGDRLYLRSLSQDKPSESPASLEDDFPSLKADFCLPPELSYVEETKFSSVLRISGNVNMWLHYDVMANVYMQIQGSKRMILFPPEDVTKLSFGAGASSSSLDVFAALDASTLTGTSPHEALLSPGDTLFLPPMWLHTAKPTTPMSIAVNVFFRDLDSGYSSGRDVYGNRDLAAYEKGRQEVARITKAFQHLPGDIRIFYMARLAQELLQAAEEN